MRRLVVVSCLIVSLTRCGERAPESSAPAPQPAPLPAPVLSAAADEKPRLDAAIERATRDILRENPELSTTLGISEERAGGPFNDRLADYSRAGSERAASIANALADDLRSIPRDALAPGDAVTYDVAMTAAESMVAGAAFGYGKSGAGPVQPYIVTQIDGAYATVPDFLDSRHQVKSKRDAEDYLARLAAFARVLDQETETIKLDAARGVAPPTFVIDGAVKQLSAIVKQKPADMTLVRSLATRVDALADSEKDAGIASRAEGIVAKSVIPAMQRQIAALKALRKDASADAGVWRLPNGEALYRAALEAWNTTSMTPDEIHELGLKIVADATAELTALLDANAAGGKGTTMQRMGALSRSKAQLYANTDAGRVQLINDLNAQVAAMSALLPTYFATLPKTPLEIRRVPVDIQAGAPGGYYISGPIDGSRPGVYYINLRDTAEWPKFTLPTLTYHEGIPGHHFQISISQENGELPLLRSSILGFSGYIEGWGLYAEQLAVEMGAYQDNPLGRIGYLQSVIFRGARLVVDTGLHAKRWTREQAVDYMMKATGHDRAAMTTEVDRYCVWPGQATAYMVGRETINRLREKAKTELREKFDIKAFHDIVLTNGAMPLSVLEGVVDAHIRDVGKAAPVAAAPAANAE